MVRRLLRKSAKWAHTLHEMTQAGGTDSEMNHDPEGATRSTSMMFWGFKSWFCTEAENNKGSKTARGV